MYFNEFLNRQNKLVIYSYSDKNLSLDFELPSHLPTWKKGVPDVTAFKQRNMYYFSYKRDEPNSNLVKCNPTRKVENIVDFDWFRRFWPDLERRLTSVVDIY